MYSYETLFSVTGDRKWAERLEVIAYNALPAAISEDMWTHQYVQMSNQIACMTFPGRSLFRTNNSEAHLFGLEPHFGCCTANFNQGWPKLTLSSFMHNGNKIINAMLLPASLSCDLADISLKTDYPFENTMKYTISAKEDFTFEVRIPSFAKNLLVDGKAQNTGDLSFNLKKGEERIITASFETVPFVENRPHGLHTVKCGSLVFSLPISYEKKMHEYERNGVERKFPYCDYELCPASDWSFGISSPDIKIEKHGIAVSAFCEKTPAITAKVKVKKISWGFEDGFDTVCAKIPESVKAQGDEVEMSFIPYGCAKLRVTELPFAE